MTTGFIIALGPTTCPPTATRNYQSMEAAVDEATGLVAKNGVDREVWTAMPYRGFFVGVGRVRTVSADGGTQI